MGNLYAVSVPVYAQPSSLGLFLIVSHLKGSVIIGVLPPWDGVRGQCPANMSGARPLFG